jgi:hypothetical protein
VSSYKLRFDTEDKTQKDPLEGCLQERDADLRSCLGPAGIGDSWNLLTTNSFTITPNSHSEDNGTALSASPLDATTTPACAGAYVYTPAGNGVERWEPDSVGPIHAE